MCEILKEDAQSYLGKKGYPIFNVLVVCSIDLKFTYVLPGWEGITFDLRIIKNVLI